MSLTTTTHATPIMPSNAMPTNPTGMAGKVGRYRWAICAMLFVATTINYEVAR